MQRIAIYTLFIFFVFTPYIWSQEPAMLEPVEIFDKSYGTSEMDRAADVVTADFRDGRPKSVWVSETWRILNKIEYERIESKVVDSGVEAENGFVRLHVKIKTVGGTTVQDEVYQMKKIGDKWQIDGLNVLNEEVKEEEKEL